MVDGGRPASFGTLLRRHRLAAGLTQLALAGRAELSARGLAFLERGARRPYPDTVRRLADALELSGEKRAAFIAASHAEPPATNGDSPSGPAPTGDVVAAPMGNLLTPLTSLVDRTQEWQAVLALLESSRLVTLTGTGGIGKTRLALAVAADLVNRYDGDVWLVDLAPLAETTLVPAAVARVLHLEEEAHRPLLTTLTDRLKRRRLLLVLDNCEHLVASCAALVDALLRGCPEVRVLATSRETLRVPGERAFRVPALPLPNPDTLPDFGALSAYGAVELFLQRARDRLPDFALNAHNMESVVAICARLDGIPLAIELAAARVGVLSTTAIADRLDARFALLTEGPRTALPRQQTLQATLDWSYGLLDTTEQALLRQLAVFANGWTLAAAETVCGEGERWQTLDVLAGLVNKSLVQVVEHAEEPRYTFLETVHHYAWDQLRAAGEETVWRDRHLRWSVTLAELAEPELTGGAQEHWLARLEIEHGNLRAALAWAEAHGATAMGLRLAGALWRFWYTRGSVSEGRAWCERLLAQDSGDASDDGRRWRAKVLVGGAGLAYRQGDFAHAVMLAEDGRALYRELDDLQGQANALTVLAVIARDQGEPQRARDMQEDILAIRRALSDRHGTAAALHNLALIHDNLGDYSRARAFYEESLALSRAEGSSTVVANTLNSLGTNAWMQGDLDRAELLCAESLAVARRTGARSVESYALIGLGTVAVTRGRYDEARKAYEESLVLRQEIGDIPGVAGAYTNLAHVARHQGRSAEAGALYRASLALHGSDRVDRTDLAECLQGLAAIWHARGHLERAAWLVGVVAGLYSTSAGAVPAPENHLEFEHITNLVRSALGAGHFDKAWAEGQSLSLREAIARVLETEPGH
jgi:predicted ATPase/Tfp pilus assembly protein PilF